MKHVPIHISCLVLLSTLGCDRSPGPPPAPVEHSSAATKPIAATRPTTQELNDGPRHALVLGSLPLVMDVPESWRLDTADGSGTWLVGPTPHGQVRIQLTTTATDFTAKTLVLMDEQLRKEAVATHGMTETKPLRPLGAAGVKLREQREKHAGTIIDDQGNVTQTEVMDWSVEVYVPEGKGYMMDSLRFVMLSAEQYGQDKDFLEKIVASIRYDATKGLLQ